MKKFDQINVIPFIDIMLVLLAIVLMTATFISQGKIAVKLPEVSDNESISQDEMKQLITIKNDGVFYYGEDAMTIESLDAILKTLPSDNKITLKVDAEVIFQDFISITDLLAKHQLANVSVITEKISANLNAP